MHADCCLAGAPAVMVGCLFTAKLIEANAGLDFGKLTRAHPKWFATGEATRG